MMLISSKLNRLVETVAEPQNPIAVNREGMAILESGEASKVGFLADRIGSRELNVAKASFQGIYS